MDLGLENRIALITGGSIGIGLAVAKEFLAEKAEVIICARDEERIQKVTAELNAAFPGKAHGMRCDVTKPEDIQVLAAYAKDLGGVDILVNNAGSGSEEKIMTADDAKWYRYWDLHVMSALRLSRLVVPMMKERNGEGVILNVTSICAAQPLYYEPIYNVTKAALNMLTKCMSAEFIADKIRVLAVAPGLVLTPDWYKTAGVLSKQEGITVEQYFDRIAASMTPLSRYASPEEVAKTFVFLASKQSSYTLGTTVYLDAGAIKTLL